MADPRPSSLFQLVWRPTFLGLGALASGVWTALLGYGVVELVGMAPWE